MIETLGISALIKILGDFPLARDGQCFNGIGALIKILGDFPLAWDDQSLYIRLTSNHHHFDIVCIFIEEYIRHRGSADARARLADVHVHALALADEGASVSGHVDDSALGDLPHGLVDVAYLLGELVDIMDRSAVGDHPVVDALGPMSVGCEVTHKVLVDDGEFSGEDSVYGIVAWKENINAR